MAERKSLLKRYGIPLNHLDFEYVKQCDDAKEIERIVHILQSGEEGFYPDLTKCAEDKLRLLKPSSRLFRCEVPLLRGDAVSETDIQPIKDFSREARDKDRRLAAIKGDDEGLPPIRNSGKINLSGESKGNENGKSGANGSQSTIKTSGKKISSTDYEKWDRFDADEEILRMDLAEERKLEEIESKNRLNEMKFSKSPIIEEIKDEDARIRNLTDIERDSLAEEYRLRGNECFRVKEYENALKEYTRTITLNPEKDAAAYNNRAITYMKLKKHTDAINDCLKCLSIEPNNMKAMYRLAESNMESGYKEKALELFRKVLELDPNHAGAKNFVQTLVDQVFEKVPPHATRLRIEEGPSLTSLNTNQKQTKKSTKKIVIKTPSKAKEKEKEKEKDYDLASIVRPKEIVPNKWMDTAANMMAKSSVGGDKNNTNPVAPINTKTSLQGDCGGNEIRFPMLNESTNSKLCKPLIEEL